MLLNKQTKGAVNMLTRSPEAPPTGCQRRTPTKLAFLMFKLLLALIVFHPNLCLRLRPGGGASFSEESAVAGPQSAAVRTIQASAARGQKPPSAAAGHQHHRAGGAQHRHGNTNFYFLRLSVYPPSLSFDFIPSSLLLFVFLPSSSWILV